MAAADLPERVVAAQHDVRALEARLGLVERGWNPAVPERRFRGRLSYRAPETLSLTLDDRTDYPPGGWPANDLRLAVAEDRWEVSGLRDCPSPAQPACTPAIPDRRSTSGRPPFSPASPAPLELIMPVQSFALAGTTASLPPAPVDGRPTVGIETTAAQVGPLLDALRPTGNLRLVHPADTVRLRLDEETLVPLRVSVRAAPGADRRAWAQARGYTERAGDTVLDLTVSDLVVNGEPTGLPAADGTDAAPDGGPADGGFVDGPVSVDEVPDPDGLPPGLAPHRTGHARTAGGPRVAVRTWSDGRAWLALSATADWPGGRLFGDLGTLVRRVDLGPAGVGYLSEDGTRLALHAAGRDLVLTGSVERSLLVGAARGLGVVGTAVPDTWAEAATADVGDAVGAMAPLSLLLPPALDGFAPPALRVDDGWVVASFVGAGDRAFLLEQGPAAKLPPPSDADDVVPVTVRGRPGRFAPPRGELEWFEGGAVVRLRSLTLARGELLAIADRLAPA
ncbi:MAG: hypothetical protein H6518_15945 [Microthrixaceae bacterium]|nr:hypothetical protein [Microthrixaceae bacterium]